MLPLFPLGLVLLPGLVLPLHVFEDRYRVLVGELLERPEDQRDIGIVAIRQGREVGEEGVAALHEVGTVARLRRVSPYPDGRYDIVVTGGRRFRLDALERGKPYLRGHVELLPDEVGDEVLAGVLATAVGQATGDYLAALRSASGEELDELALPSDPTQLSYAVAAALLVDLEDRQRLLAAPDATTRLRAELALLRHETRLLSVLSSAPAPELARTPVNPN